MDQAMIAPIHCPHWECSRDFHSERALFEHYRSVHDGTVTDEREYYNNLRNAGGKDLVLSLIDGGLSNG